MKSKTEPTYTDLQSQIIDLTDQLDDCRDLRKEHEARVRVAATLVTRARNFATAYHAHPWSNNVVYEAGQELIKAARQLP